MISSTTFGKFYQCLVTCGGNRAIFFSENMISLLPDVIHFQFDGTFFTVPVQFSQLWTIFGAIGRHTLPAIHCLMTAKSQELYKAVLDTIRARTSHFKPSASMSDCEPPAPKNALKEIHPKIHACWYHYTQCIWRKMQKLGLSQFKNNIRVATYIRQLMDIPFLDQSNL